MLQNIRLLVVGTHPESGLDHLFSIPDDALLKAAIAHLREQPPTSAVLGHIQGQAVAAFALEILDSFGPPPPQSATGAAKQPAARTPVPVPPAATAETAPKT